MEGGELAVEGDAPGKRRLSARRVKMDIQLGQRSIDLNGFALAFAPPL